MKVSQIVVSVVLLLGSSMCMAGGYTGLYGYEETDTFSQKKQSGSSYDYTTGSNYYWNTGTSGSTYMNGYNTQTGSNWNTTIKDNGDMYGFDSKGHSWSYDRGSGMYMNYNTGEMRIHNKTGR